MHGDVQTEDDFCPQERLVSKTQMLISLNLLLLLLSLENLLKATSDQLFSTDLETFK